MRVTAATKKATRKRILEVAQEQFAARGFDATTTRDIAAAAGIAVGTLFNYFATKEALVEGLVAGALEGVAERFAGSDEKAGMRTLEEELFALVATTLRKLQAYRTYLPAVLETAFSPLVADRCGDASALRVGHLEAVDRIAARHGHQAGLTPVALQLYWTLFTGVLAFWAADSSPRQEDTLALLDQSLAMFLGWLDEQTKSRPTGG